jgi:hypothetical protein
MNEVLLDVKWCFQNNGKTLCNFPNMLILEENTQLHTTLWTIIWGEHFYTPLFWKNNKNETYHISMLSNKLLGMQCIVPLKVVFMWDKLIFHEWTWRYKQKNNCTTSSLLTIVQRVKSLLQWHHKKSSPIISRRLNYPFMIQNSSHNQWSLQM